MAANEGDLAELGLIGLGTMGRNLTLNIAENGFKIAVFNRTVETTRKFHQDAGPLAYRIVPTETLEDFVASIREPRTFVLMVPAGEVVDGQIAALRKICGPNDLIIDAGNANFNDTRTRSKAAEAAGVPFLGIGVSGGEEGARHGPSIMGGGPRAAWDKVSHILEAISAKHEGTACATWMGNDGAGHFVKTVHNGIEYADMQMIAEAYGIMRDGMGLSANHISDIFEKWDEGVLKSYLIEISAIVSGTEDAKSSKPLLDIILDKAGQKGTGRWTAIEAQHLAAPASVIEAAVLARNLSAALETRKKGETIFGAAPQKIDAGTLTIEQLERALIAGKIVCYAQGFGLLAQASDEFNWDLPMPEIAKVWRQGCIIRSTMLNDMASALAENPADNLMFAPKFIEYLKDTEQDLRKVVSVSALSGLPAPALSSALSYFDIMRTGRSTANMIQAQRDFFGAHSFGRIGEDGAHHGPWNNG